MTVVEDYQANTEALAASTVASVLAVYAAMQSDGVAPAVAVPAMAAVIATANAAATTLADVFASAQIEAATGRPQPPTGIAPRDDTERLTKAVETILEDVPEAPAPAAEPDVSPVPNPVAVPEEPDVVELVAAPEEPDAVEPDEAAHRLERLARSEPLDTGLAITVEIFNRVPVVEGWTRKLDADPCERCIRWAEDGRVFPKGHHFKRHLQCNCQPEIVTSTEGKAS